ncbi:SPOR domain-containing protein [Leisingera methylohalidivorans]|uniref:Sporulation protein n=1 Tax=Leisingera methylohalidivorans DSM 14336 TaxID=999552 RepID=V9VR39_9RHOB|nr:SPOR domain-containing protein [Leisingera methylohalidivorans]AHD00498.1 sporulation protein [Leisingera methylohalidivorans DSM 14336]
MKITRIIALAIIAGISGAAGIQAQTLRETSPPAEFPPVSYTGKQYVDSRGCIYIRAGIDGNVAWVPRVSRSRKQICGYAPTKLAGTTRQQQAAPAPELITLEPGRQPAQSAAAAPAPAKRTPSAAKPAAAAPRVVTTAKPRRTPQSTSAGPAAAAAAAAPEPAAKRVVRVTPKPAPAPAVPAQAAAQPAAGGACAGLSDISRQYSNAAGVRCGPQAVPPVTYGGQGSGAQSSLRLTPNTRVVQTHIYQDRRLSNSFTVPRGYRPVWSDGRLNPQRAVRTVRPAVVTGSAQVPAGYLAVEREDGRLNRMRGVHTPEGDAQMARIWTDGVPRKLVQLPLDRPTLTLPRRARRSPAEAQPSGLRLSSRSAPQAVAPQQTAARLYVRAATFSDAGQATAAARRLAASGLPVRLGTVSRKGQPYKVVLAGPFRHQAKAAAALIKVQKAGFSGAKLGK